MKSCLMQSLFTVRPPTWPKDGQWAIVRTDMHMELNLIAYICHVKSSKVITVSKTPIPTHPLKKIITVVQINKHFLLYKQWIFVYSKQKAGSDFLAGLTHLSSSYSNIAHYFSTIFFVI